MESLYLQWLIQLFILCGLLHFLVAAMLATYFLMFFPGFFEENNPAKTFATFITDAYKKRNEGGDKYIPRSRAALEQVSELFFPKIKDNSFEIRKLTALIENLFSTKSLKIYQGFFLHPIKTFFDGLGFAGRKFRILRKLFRMAMECFRRENPEAKPSLREKIEYFNRWLPSFLKSLSFEYFPILLKEYVNSLTFYDQNMELSVYQTDVLFGLLKSNDKNDAQKDHGFLKEYYSDNKYRDFSYNQLFFLGLTECFSDFSEEIEKALESFDEDSLTSFHGLAPAYFFQTEEKRILNRFSYFIAGLYLFPRLASVDLLALDSKVFVGFEKFLDIFGCLFISPDLAKPALVKWMF